MRPPTAFTHVNGLIEKRPLCRVQFKYLSIRPFVPWACGGKIAGQSFPSFLSRVHLGTMTLILRVFFILLWSSVNSMDLFIRTLSPQNSRLPPKRLGVSTTKNRHLFFNMSHNGINRRRGGIEQRIRVRLIGGVAVLLIFLSNTVEAFSTTSSTRRGTRLLVSPEDTTGTEKKKISNAEHFDWFQQWYPAIPLSCLEEQGHIQSKPHSCTILDKTIAIWNSGTTKDGVTQSWSAVDDTCPHRRAALSTGKVVGTRDGSCNLACRYHGWQFNSTGACVKIPALDRNLTASDARAFKILSYPTKLSNGMLWVFLDPTVPRDALPEIPTGALIPEEEYNDKVWTHFFFVTPVSHLSMTENAFDPFHAPFVHQGESEFGGLNYSPSRATPMKRYQLMGDVSKEGFVLEHTPYYETDDPSDEITTREFVSPCSTITKKPNSEIRIHFVPQSARETRVIFMLGMPKPKNAMQRLGYRIFASDTVHTLFQLNDGSTRFADQDRIIMQGQDERKMGTGTKWRDLYPTTSDAGVAAYQRWIQMFGAPFRTDQIVETQKANSMWERHGKHCSQCQRSLRRLTQLRGLSSRFSSISLLLSGLTAFASIGIKSKFCPPLSVSILLLVAGVLLRVVKSWTVNTEAKMYSEEGAKRHIDEVYTF